MPVRVSAARPLLLVVLLLAAVTALLVPVPARAATARWDCLARYESSQRWHINTGNGYYGGLQFNLRTWRYYGGRHYSGNVYPNKATRAEQIHIAERVAFRGWLGRAPQGGRHAWPNTWPRC